MGNYSSNSNNNINNNAQFSIFDQIVLEREQNVQESIIKSYSKEIEKLNNEIKLLKAINADNRVAVPNKLTNNDMQFQMQMQNKIDLFDNISVAKHNNFLSNNSNCNDIIKDSAEEKIKKLNKLITNPDTKITYQDIEKEFSHFEKIISSSGYVNINSNCKLNSGEIDLDSYLKIFTQKLNIPLSKYELIEIFNNFPRTKDNNIRYIQLLNAINSRDPSNFFIQPDPSYINSIEKRIINYESKIKELEKELEGKKIIENELNEKIKILKSENNELCTKVSSSNGNDLLGNIMKNNFLMAGAGNPNSNTISNLKIKEDPYIIKLKDKIKKLEKSNESNLKEFEKKIEKYEDKFNSISGGNSISSNKNKKVNNINNNSVESNNKNESEILKLHSDISNLKEENILLKAKQNQIEKDLKNEISANESRQG